MPHKFVRLWPTYGAPHFSVEKVIQVVAHLSDLNELVRF